jgi:hypothetical protein
LVVLKVKKKKTEKVFWKGVTMFPQTLFDKFPRRIERKVKVVEKMFYGTFSDQNKSLVKYNSRKKIMVAATKPVKKSFFFLKCNMQEAKGSF